MRDPIRSARGVVLHAGRRARRALRRVAGAVSLRVRLTAALVLVVVPALAGGWLLLARDLEHELSDAVTKELRIRVDDVLAAGDAVVSDDDVAAQVVDRANRVLAPPGASPILTDAEVAAVGASARLTDRAVPGVGEHARILAYPDGERVVVAAASTATVERARRRMLLLLGVAAPAAVVFVAGAGWLLTGAALRPVRRMTRRAEQLSVLEPASRLPLPPGDDEIAQLGRTLNRMLARIEATVARERVFIDDASHELRTPIALLRAELELALLDLDDPQATRASLESALEEAHRLTRLTESLLLLARADAGQLGGRVEPVDLTAAVTRVAARTPVRPGVDLELPAERPAVVLGDGPLLERLVANLLSNGLRHCDRRVRVEVRVADEQVHLAVADDGRGFPPALLDRIFDRFVRTGAGGGARGTRAGLGLAIVAAIAHRFGARVDAANGPPLGGAVVRVRFPAPGAGPAREASTGAAGADRGARRRSRRPAR
ncbi:MAG: hypothetical protein KatS3mg009_2088 [Acidimicrobiia bacterium]|nr:MAG: hypothetical protein KatS3mg009_2088 [Acidimicrobiia bacterium]